MPRQPRPEGPVTGTHPRPPDRSALHIQLVPQRQNVELEGGPRTEHTDHEDNESMHDRHHDPGSFGPGGNYPWREACCRLGERSTGKLITDIREPQAAARSLEFPASRCALCAIMNETLPPSEFSVEGEEEVGGPTVWHSALAGRTLDGEVSASSPASGKELSLAVAD